jgi:uncharacterized protein YacL
MYFESEYKRASISTVITELFKFLSNYILVYGYNDKPIFNSIIYIISIVIHYTLDIFVAKSFKSNDIRVKLNWYMNSFIKTNFSKYIVFSILHFLVSQNIKKYIQDVLNKHELNHKYRDISLTLLLNVFLFALYGYFLKFKWAYADSSDPLMTMIVLNWCTLSIMIYTLSNKISS